MIRVYTETVCGMCGLVNCREGAEGGCPPVGWAIVKVTIRHEGSGWTNNSKDEAPVCPDCAEKVKNLVFPKEDSDGKN